MNTNSFKDFFKINFTHEKVKKDFYEYLKSNFQDAFDGEFFNIQTEEFYLDDNFKLVKISPNDNITIYQYQSDFKFNTDLYYYVSVGIGKFINRGEDRLYGVEKCEALLKYNADFSLYDLEFFYDKITEIS